MNEFFISFIVGFLCTATLFCLCFLLVIGAKVLYLTSKRLLSKPPVPPPQVKEVVKRAPRTARPAPKPVRSIEIDPATIDRIYVKKAE